MFEFFKDMSNDYDIMFFLPHEELQSNVEVHLKKFADPGEPVGGSDIGSEWHVVLFKIDEEGLAEDIDTFDAIFSDPKEYVSTLIPLNFFGVVARKTTKSKIFLDDFIDKLSPA